MSTYTYTALHQMLREKQRLLGDMFLSRECIIYDICVLQRIIYDVIKKARFEFREESTTKN